MTGPRYRRRIGWLPQKQYFKPEGEDSSLNNEIILTLDEAEALRLADVEGLYQEEAAKRMNVSRPTFGRILEIAHRKVADAIVNGKAIKLEGGVVELDENATVALSDAFCVCPKCGFRKPHTPGVPCRAEVCPNCGTPLIREYLHDDISNNRKKRGGE
jgi:predicted DNA-binding protein (UPF0251 family)